MFQEKTFNHIEGLLFVLFEKKLDHMFVCFSHSIFMTNYLEFLFVFVNVMFFLLVYGLRRSGLA